MSVAVSQALQRQVYDQLLSEGCACFRGITPPKLTAGHYSAVFNDELWVFPGPRNHNMRKAYCCDLQRFRWVERDTRGDPPALAEARRNLDCFLDGSRLIVFGELLPSKNLPPCELFPLRRLQSCKQHVCGLVSCSIARPCSLVSFCCGRPCSLMSVMSVLSFFPFFLFFLFLFLRKNSHWTFSCPVSMSQHMASSSCTLSASNCRLQGVQSAEYW